MSDTAYLSRVLQLLLQPLQGSYSTGGATVLATSQETALSPGDVLVPILDGCESEESAVKIDPNPATTDHSWPITAAGTEVAISSLQGGAHVNLPAGTQLRFDEAPTGIEELASVSEAMSGGTRLDTFGTLRQVRAFKDLGNVVDQQALFAAQLGDYPAAVLSWVATSPGDGSASPSFGVEQIRVGNGTRIYCHEWALFIITTRYDSSDRRKREGDVIRDRVLRILTDRSKWRGVQLSLSKGIKVTDARLVRASDNSYVDVVRFCSWFTLKRTEERVFNDWLITNLQEARPITTTEGVTSNRVEVDIDVTMPTGD